jgi:hypothetical protein
VSWSGSSLVGCVGDPARKIRIEKNFISARIIRWSQKWLITTLRVVGRALFVWRRTWGV